MVLSLAFGAGAVVVGAYNWISNLYTYNRDAWMTDIQVDQNHCYQSENLKIQMYGMDREEVRDVMQSNINKINNTILVTTLILALAGEMLFEGQVPEGSPAFVLNPYMICLGSAAFHLVLSILFGVFASNEAYRVATDLLTKTIRPDWKRHFQDMRHRKRQELTAAFEEKAATEIFRPPLATRLAKTLESARPTFINVPTKGERTCAQHCIPRAAQLRRRPTALAGGQSEETEPVSPLPDTYQLEPHPASRRDSSPKPLKNPRHAQLHRKAQSMESAPMAEGDGKDRKRWRDHWKKSEANWKPLTDCMFLCGAFGTKNLLEACGYWCLGTLYGQYRLAWAYWGVQVIFVTLNMLMMKFLMTKQAIEKALPQGVQIGDRIRVNCEQHDEHNNTGIVLGSYAKREVLRVWFEDRYGRDDVEIPYGGYEVESAHACKAKLQQEATAMLSRWSLKHPWGVALYPAIGPLSCTVAAATPDQRLDLVCIPLCYFVHMTVDVALSFKFVGLVDVPSQRLIPRGIVSSSTLPGLASSAVSDSSPQQKSKLQSQPSTPCFKSEMSRMIEGDNGGTDSHSRHQFRDAQYAYHPMMDLEQQALLQPTRPNNFHASMAADDEQDSVLDDDPCTPASRGDPASGCFSCARIRQYCGFNDTCQIETEEDITDFIGDSSRSELQSLPWTLLRWGMRVLVLLWASAFSWALLGALGGFDLRLDFKNKEAFLSLDFLYPPNVDFQEIKLRAPSAFFLATSVVCPRKEVFVANKFTVYKKDGDDLTPVPCDINTTIQDLDAQCYGETCTPIVLLHATPPVVWMCPENEFEYGHGWPLLQTAQYADKFTTLLTDQDIQKVCNTETLEDAMNYQSFLEVKNGKDFDTGDSVEIIGAHGNITVRTIKNKENLVDATSKGTNFTNAAKLFFYSALNHSFKKGSEVKKERTPPTRLIAAVGPNVIEYKFDKKRNGYVPLWDVVPEDVSRAGQREGDVDDDPNGREGGLTALDFSIKNGSKRLVMFSTGGLVVSQDMDTGYKCGEWRLPQGSNVVGGGCAYEEEFGSILALVKNEIGEVTLQKGVLHGEVECSKPKKGER